MFHPLFPSRPDICKLSANDIRTHFKNNQGPYEALLPDLQPGLQLIASKCVSDLTTSPLIDHVHQLGLPPRCELQPGNPYIMLSIDTRNDPSSDTNLSFIALDPEAIDPAHALDWHYRIRFLVLIFCITGK